jgi:adenylate kinase
VKKELSDRVKKTHFSGKYNMIMIGPQGSGKGTQADLLAKKLKIPHISTGDIFRAIKAKDTPLGRTVRDLIDNGNLVPDKIVLDVVAVRLKEHDTEEGFIFDGFPRTLPQAMAFDSMYKVTHCVLIEIGDDESIRRISARRICPKCKTNFNIIYIKPKIVGICDNCGTKLVVRDDDKPDSVKLRLKKYHDETEPLVKFYEKKGVLLRVKGEQDIAKVHKDIVRLLD